MCVLLSSGTALSVSGQSALAETRTEAFKSLSFLGRTPVMMEASSILDGFFSLVHITG